MRDRIVLILNPKAGGGAKADRVRAAAADVAGLEIRETADGDDAARLAREALEAGSTTLIAAGGDGLVSGVVKGMSPDFGRARLGIVPAGTGNDFARSAGIPDDPAAALAVVRSGIPRRIDLVCVRGARSPILVNAATGGFSTELDEVIDEEMKARWGRFAYVLAALQRITSVPIYSVEAAIDDRERIAARTCAVLVANGRYAGGLEVAPEADAADRRIEVVLITAEGFGERAAVAARLAAGTHLDAEGVIFRRCRRLRLEARPPMPFHIDGDPGGETPLEFEVLPGALELLLPAAEGPAPR